MGNYHSVFVLILWESRPIFKGYMRLLPHHVKVISTG